jgi:hypothetical protein
VEVHLLEFTGREVGPLNVRKMSQVPIIFKYLKIIDNVFFYYLYLYIESILVLKKTVDSLKTEEVCDSILLSLPNLQFRKLGYVEN